LNKISAIEFVNRTHQEHNDKTKCHCGKFAPFGYSYRFGMLELLCFEHYKERIKSCPTEKEHTEAKSEDQKNQLNLL